LTYDNACKYLAESYPKDIIRWLLNIETNDISVLKTELSLEPIRADSLTLLRTVGKILHLEFQTSPYSTPAIPLRMLDYYVRLKKQHECQIEQVVIFLQSTTSQAVFINQYTDTNTNHSYRVLRLWEQNPTLLLENPALLPFATLAQSESPIELLAEVAERIARIEEPPRKSKPLRLRSGACWVEI
jgi:predicted transposase YdaD